MDSTIEFLKAMGEENRLRILILLEQAGELSVADMSEILDIAQPKVSRHLARLRLSGWVKERRWQGFAMYRVYAEQSTPHREYLVRLAETLESDPVVAADMQRLLALLSTKTPME